VPLIHDGCLALLGHRSIAALVGHEDNKMRARVVLSVFMLVPLVPATWAAGGGPMPSFNAPTPREQSPQEQAKSLYNDGIHDVHKADDYQADATGATDPKKKEKALGKAHDRYAAALGKFSQAVKLDSDLYEAWNYVGYTNRKLGNYDVALAAYERALTLHPGYPEALEYRGEAFLALNRISDAQQAYLDLFAANRGLADRLLSAMRGWVDAQRAAGSGADATAVDALDKWVQERAQIAGQTAALTREGAAAGWR
jgi:tetratricopeptide (TPR) repeat protein